jgi:hypothetical protein
MFLDVSPESYCNICNLPMAPWQVSSPWLPQCLQSKRRSSPSSKRRDPAPYTGVGRATDLHTPRTEIGKSGKEHTGNPIAHIFSTAYGNHMIYDHKQLVDVLYWSFCLGMNGKENRRYVLRYESRPIRSDTCIVLPQVPVKTRRVRSAPSKERKVDCGIRKRTACCLTSYIPNILQRSRAPH